MRICIHKLLLESLSDLVSALFAADSPGMMDARRARGDRWYREKLEEATTALVGPNGDTDVHNTAKKRKAPANVNPGCKRRRV